MFTAGTPTDGPAAGDVLVTSLPVTSPRQYIVKVSIASEAPFWAVFIHRTSAGGEGSRIYLPCIGSMFGSADLAKIYFAEGDYGEIIVREGVATVSGTVQANIELA